MRVYLETDRLRSRELTRDDVDHLVVLDGDPEVMRWTNPGGTRAPRSEYEEQILPRFLAWYERLPGFGFWVAVEKDGDDFLGWFHFRPSRDVPEEIELGYRLLAGARNKGYATEVSRALIQRGFTHLGVQCVTANSLADNRASRRVMEKSGLLYQSTFVYPKIGLTGVKYMLDRRDWANSLGETIGQTNVPL